MIQERGELADATRLVEQARAPLTLTITLRPDGLLAIQAPLGDKAFCLKLLEEARAAIARQSDPTRIVVPGEDVDSRPMARYG